MLFEPLASAFEVREVLYNNNKSLLSTLNNKRV